MIKKKSQAETDNCVYKVTHWTGTFPGMSFNKDVVNLAHMIFLLFYGVPMIQRDLYLPGYFAEK